MRYNINCLVQQEIVKALYVELDAESIEDAESRLNEMLKTYPREIQVDGVHRVQPMRELYELPSTVDIVDIREDKRFG